MLTKPKLILMSFKMYEYETSQNEPDALRNPASHLRTLNRIVVYKDFSSVWALI